MPLPGSQLIACAGPTPFVPPAHLSGVSEDPLANIRYGLAGYWPLFESGVQVLRRNLAGPTHLGGFLADGAFPAVAPGLLGRNAQLSADTDDAVFWPDEANSAFPGNTFPEIHFGDTDFHFGIWAKLTSTPGTVVLLSSWTTTGVHEDLLLFIASGRWTWQISRDGTGANAGITTANNFGDLPLNQWMRIDAWYDAVRDRLGIQINAGPPNVVSYAGGAKTPTRGLVVGNHLAFGLLAFPGQYQMLSTHKRLLTQSEIEALYARGAGYAIV